MIEYTAKSKGVLFPETGRSRLCSFSLRSKGSAIDFLCIYQYHLCSHSSGDIGEGERGLDFC